MARDDRLILGVVTGVPVVHLGSIRHAVSVCFNSQVWVNLLWL
jgi:hypothetical protein